MLLLAGLIGMAAVSAATMWGFEELGSDNARDDVAAPGDMEESDIDSPPASSDATSLLDIATSDDGAVEDDPEADDYGILRGTNVADTMSGTAINEFLDGLAGDDTLSAGDGDDVARGGEGNDSIAGNTGDDTLRGEAGNDTIAGGAGQDSLMGHEGDDLLRGGADNDSLIGGEGGDTLSGGEGDDALHGYLGNDDLDGDAGADTLFGGDGNDTLTGVTPDGTTPEDDIDYLNGGSGNDNITLGAGDIATGGNGADSFTLGDWLDADHQGRIMDFNTTEDSLAIFYDDSSGANPDITIQEDADVDGLHRVLLDGEVVAEVSSDARLTLDHVTLIPQSMA